MSRVIPAAEVLGPVIADLERVLDSLSDLAARVADATPAGPARRADLVALRPVIFGLLAAHRGLVAGAGVITAPGLLADAARCLEWWWTSPSGEPEPLRVNLDPRAPDFYDYTAAAWFRPTAEAGQRQVAGPYVDHACTGEYTLTLSTPVPHRDRPLGVAAADVLVANLEPLVLPAMAGLGYPVALTGPDGRVIVSTSPSWPPGLRLPAAGRSGRGRFRPVTAVRRAGHGAPDPAGSAPDPEGPMPPFRSWLLVETEDAVAGPAGAGPLARRRVRSRP